MKMGRTARWLALGLALALFILGLFWFVSKNIQSDYPMRGVLSFRVEVRNSANQWFDLVEVPIPVPLARGPWHEGERVTSSDPMKLRSDLLGNREAVIRFSDFEKEAVKVVSFQVPVRLKDGDPVGNDGEDWSRFAARGFSPEDALDALRAQGWVVRHVAGVRIVPSKGTVESHFEPLIERQMGNAWMPFDADPKNLDTVARLLAFRVGAETAEFERGAEMLQGFEGFRFQYSLFELR